MTLLIEGGRVFNTSQMILERADVLVEGNQIVAVGPALGVPEHADRLDAAEHLVLPGLINAHTHSHNNLSRGMGDNWTLENAINHSFAVWANRTPDEQYLSAALGAIEMLKTGCTGAYDLCTAVPAPTDESVEAVVRAHHDVGLRAVVCPTVSDIAFYQTVPGFIDLLPRNLRLTVESIDSEPTDGLLKFTERAIKRWHGFANGRIQLALGPSIPGQCTDALLAGFVRIMRDLGVGLHTHLAETKIQAVFGSLRWGRSIVSQLVKMGLVGPSFVAAHCVWITADDIRMLADRGATVVHNPASNLKLGSGIAPVREMFDSGLNVALGSDGSMTSDNQNMFEAMRFAAMVGKVRFPHQEGRWIGARESWEMATSHGARALGLVDRTGAVKPGQKADLILLRANSLFMQPLNNALNTLVYAETAASVETVLVDGRVVVKHGRVLTVDENRLRDQAQEAADRLRSVNATEWALAEKLAPYITTACRATAISPFPINRYAVSIE